MNAINKPRNLWAIAASCFACVATASCTSQVVEKPAPPGENARKFTTSTGSPSSKGESPMKSTTNVLAVTSTAFGDGQAIPKKFTGDGQDLSPPLAWKEAGTGAGAKQWALICDDPDAPTDEPWVHWVLYGIPADVRSLAEGVGTTDRLKEPTGALQGRNSWPNGRKIGYRGPAPPKGHGVHHYHFKLYALDSALALKSDLTKNELLKALDGHVVGTGELIGTYERK